METMVTRAAQQVIDLDLLTLAEVGESNFESGNIKHHLVLNGTSLKK